MHRSHLALFLAPSILAACASAAPSEPKTGTQAEPAHVAKPSSTEAPNAKAEAPKEDLKTPNDKIPEAMNATGLTKPASAEANAKTESVEEAPPIEPRTVVLHIGDSFLMAGFSQTLRPKMKAVGALYEIHSEQASYTTTWHLKLAKLVGDYHPDLVIINLGANEITLTDPKARADAVQRLIKIVGDRPCVWVTPPLWRKDTGIIEVIRNNIAPCRLFDSDAHVSGVSRQADGIHPDGPGGAMWAEAFWSWLQKERAPKPKPGEKVQGGSGRHAVNPWRLKPAPTPANMPEKTAAVTNP